MPDMTLTEMRLVRYELTRELRAINDDARANLEFAAMFCAIPELAAMRRSRAEMLASQAGDMCLAIAEIGDAIASQEIAV